MQATSEIRNTIPEETALDVGSVAGYDIFFGREERSASAAIDEYDRVDLRHLGTYTIDPRDAHEYDDALSVEKRECGGELDGYTAWVHVADVPSLIPEHSFMDMHARENGRTFYYGRGADHMLPKDVLYQASLEKGEDRPANTVEMRFDEDGEFQDWNVYRSIINVDRNMSYDHAGELIRAAKIGNDIEERLHNHDTIPQVYPDIEYIGRMYENLEARERDMVDDLEDLRYLATRLEHNRLDKPMYNRPPAYTAVEEFMLHANRLAASRLMEQGAGIYRAHGRPDGWKDTVASYLEQSGVPAVADEVRDAEGVDAVRALQRDFGLPLVVHGEAEERYQAYYTTVPRGHDGLGFEIYAPFTSPARRYEDMLNWRLLRGESTLDDGDLSTLALDMNRQIKPATFADEKAEFEVLAG